MPPELACDDETAWTAELLGRIPGHGDCTGLTYEEGEGLVCSCGAALVPFFAAEVVP